MRTRTERTGFDGGEPIAPGRLALKKLGGGTRYEVYLVWDERLLSLTVAKILRPDHVGDERALLELAREADILGRLAHPVLVRAFDFTLEPPHPHLLIEHLEGPTLRRLIKRYGPLPPEQLLPLALHVASVLHYLAGESVVHLDIKPGNIVMGVPPRVIDLSIARSTERAARLRDPIGTDAYMAPEQCDPEARPGAIGSPADVWGLGATLYHAIATEVPFPRPSGAGESSDRTEKFPQLVTAPRPLPDTVPAPLADLVMAMLSPRPEARPSARDVAAALKPLLDALPRKLRFTLRGVRRGHDRERGRPRPVDLPSTRPAWRCSGRSRAAGRPSRASRRCGAARRDRADQQVGMASRTPADSGRTLSG